MISTILAGLAIASLASAAEIKVTVGGTAGLKFTPPSVNAAVGDVVTFTFQQKNHTVTQSTFESPCTPLAAGFDSGFVPVAADATEFPEGQFTVKDTNPVWVYCKQGNHCSQGMVFAINPGNKLDDFVTKAKGGSVAAAPSGSSTAAAASSSVAAPAASGSPTNIKVVVGGAGLYFNPTNVKANIGDTITFEFRAKNHTVTQSTFDNPCRPIGDTVSGKTGFNSGFMPVAVDAATFPTMQVKVNDTSAVWAYCAQATHCGAGMVFAINPDTTGAKTFDAYLAKAKSLNGTSTGGSTGGSYGGKSSASRSLSSISFIAMSGALVLGSLLW